MAATKPKYISRIDAQSTHCYVLRYLPARAKIRKTVTETFSDGVWGGKTKALRAAKERLAALQHDGTITPYQRRRPNSGVTLALSYKLVDGKRYENFVFRVKFFHQESGVNTHTVFSIDRYGYHDALELAIRHRLAQEREAYGRAISSRAAYWEQLGDEPDPATWARLKRQARRRSTQ